MRRQERLFEDRQAKGETKMDGRCADCQSLFPNWECLRGGRAGRVGERKEKRECFFFSLNLMMPSLPGYRVV